MEKKSLIKGAAVLGVAGILVKFLGAFFRIPLGNYIGSVGMAYYSPAYYIYGFLLVFATTGLPVAISKMVSERCAVGQFAEAERVFKLSRTLMATIGVVGFCILFVFSDLIAAMINVPGAALSMKATAPALLIVPVMSSYRGYFQGMQDMTSTAISQLIEQLFRVICGLALAIVLVKGSAGLLTGFAPEERGAAGGCFGASTGALGGLAVMLCFYLINRKKIKQRIKNDKTTEHETKGKILKSIAAIAVPITLGAAIMPIMNLIDSGIITSRLLGSGWSRVAAESLAGQFMGFASPIIQFPQVLIQAIVVSIVPIVSAANRTGNTKELHDNISTGLRMTTLISIPAAVGMFVLAPQILVMLYPAQKASALSTAPCLQVMAIGFIFLALISTSTGVLQGIGKPVIPVINLFVGVLVKFVITWVLVAVPSINVVGAAVGSAVAYLIAAILDIIALIKYSGARPSIKNVIVKPFISAIVMGVFVVAGYKCCTFVTDSNSIATLLSVLIGVVVYGLMVIRTKTISRGEMMNISVGRKLVVICDKLKLW